MRKVQLIVHETYQGKRKSEDVFAAVFLSSPAETGYYYLQSRYYDASICRFINADDVELTGHISSFSLYVYCENNPINRVDWNGNESYINDQRDDYKIDGKKMKDIGWGLFGNVADNGCGAIAVYNVLISKNKKKIKFSSVVSALTMYGGPLAGGLLGTSPSSVLKYLSKKFWYVVSFSYNKKTLESDSKNMFSNHCFVCLEISKKCRNALYCRD